MGRITNMRLRDLDAKLVWRWDNTTGSFWWVDCPSLAQAQGVMFLCPKCYKEAGTNIGVHSVLCWFKNRGIPDDVTPGPGRWNPSGTGIDDLTFVPPGAISVQLTGGGCNWHGFVKDGDAE